MKLKQLRLQKSISVPTLSKMSGVPIRTIEEIERRNGTSIATAIKLADALNVTLDELCRDEPEK